MSKFYSSNRMFRTYYYPIKYNIDISDLSDDENLQTFAKNIGITEMRKISSWHHRFRDEWIRIYGAVHPGNPEMCEWIIVDMSGEWMSWCEKAGDYLYKISEKKCAIMLTDSIIQVVDEGSMRKLLDAMDLERKPSRIVEMVDIDPNSEAWKEKIKQIREIVGPNAQLAMRDGMICIMDRGE